MTFLTSYILHLTLDNVTENIHSNCKGVRFYLLISTCNYLCRIFKTLKKKFCQQWLNTDKTNKWGVLKKHTQETNRAAQP